MVNFDPLTTYRLSRRRLSLLLAATAALLPVSAAVAQDESAPIISTQRGEVPSTGARRPGPMNQAPPAAAARKGVAPVAITIDKAQVDAEVERLEVVDGVMQDPTGPWVVSWYENLAALGQRGNVVMAGHIDYWNVGPAVFYTIGQLAEGDQIAVTGEDGDIYTYQVEWVRNYEAGNAPIEEIVGATPGEDLTLITCGGTFDYVTREYLERTVVRANRVETPDDV